MAGNVSWAVFIARHIESVRHLPGLEQSRALVTVESNLPHNSVTIQQELAAMRLHNVRTFLENLNRPGGEVAKPGSYTSHRNKIEMIENLLSLVHQRRLMIHQSFVVATPEESMYSNMLEQFFSEFRSFKKMTLIHNSGTNLTRRPEYIYTGKPTAKDDMVMSLAIGYYVYVRLQADPALRRRNGGA